MALVPSAGLATQIASSGQAVMVAPANISGGYIVNPSSPADQGVSVEPLYVDIVSECSALVANVTTVSLGPGQKFDMPVNSSKPVWVNAASAGHNFTCVIFNGV